MPHFDAMRAYADAARRTAENGLMRESGWQIAGAGSYAGGGNVGALGTFANSTLGADLKFSGGVGFLEVARLGSTHGFRMIGAFVEPGVSVGLNIDKIGPESAKWAGRLGLFGFDVNGKAPNVASNLWFGPACKQSALTPEDFDYSFWLYLNLNGVVGAFAGDGGVLILLDPEIFADAFKSGLGFSEADRAMTSLFMAAKAYCFFAGMGIAVGVGAGAGARFFVTTRTKYIVQQGNDYVEEKKYRAHIYTGL